MFARIFYSWLVLVSVMALPTLAAADEGGISFWLTGQFGSLAAAPQKPGWSFADIYYHTSVSAGGNVAVAREFSTGAFSRTTKASLDVNLNAHADLNFVSASYVFANPVLNGQLAVSVAGAGGYNRTSIDGTLTTASATRAGSSTDSRWGFADVYPQVSLRWNTGVNNFMVYMMGDVPVGTYDSSRLANFGIGHGAIDGGGGYTYFDTKTGHEFSIVTGFTGNFRNNNTGYQNGTDWHLDWGASQFLSEQWHVGVVGYVYKQVTADSGAPPILGDNESQVLGVGPQVGYLFPIGRMKGYLNLKGYREFAASSRADGWNLWLTFALSL